jgi:hypothetical protein
VREEKSVSALAHPEVESSTRTQFPHDFNQERIRIGTESRIRVAIRFVVKEAGEWLRVLSGLLHASCDCIGGTRSNSFTDQLGSIGGEQSQPRRGEQFRFPVLPPTQKSLSIPPGRRIPAGHTRTESRHKGPTRFVSWFVAPSSACAMGKYNEDGGGTKIAGRIRTTIRILERSCAGPLVSRYPASCSTVKLAFLLIEEAPRGQCQGRHHREQWPLQDAFEHHPNAHYEKQAR